VPVDIPAATAAVPLVEIDEYSTELPLALAWEPIAGLRGFFDSDPVAMWSPGSPSGTSRRADKQPHQFLDPGPRRIPHLRQLRPRRRSCHRSPAHHSRPSRPYVALTPVFDDSSQRPSWPAQPRVHLGVSGPSLPIVISSTPPRPREPVRLHLSGGTPAAGNPRAFSGGSGHPGASASRQGPQSSLLPWR